MFKTSFTLISKRVLTHDVYELIYSCQSLVAEIPKPGQYVMFQLAPGLNRSYSLSAFTPESFTLIIKRIPDGQGSPMICDAEIGQVFHGMIPLGHFILHNTHVPKCFIGTGTGFAPLYCQALGYTSLLEQRSSKQGDGVDISSRVAFVFGVRNLEDSFYADEILDLGKQITDFRSALYLSRETQPLFQQGYVTDWITPENVSQYQEFYLCGSPAMVKNAREKLEALGISSDRVFWEQF